LNSSDFFRVECLGVIAVSHHSICRLVRVLSLSLQTSIFWVAGHGVGICSHWGRIRQSTARRFRIWLRVAWYDDADGLSLLFTGWWELSVGLVT